MDQQQSNDLALHWIENAGAILVIVGAGLSYGLEVPADEGWGDYPRPPDEDVVNWRERYGTDVNKMWGIEGPKLLRSVVRGAKLQNPSYKLLFDLLRYRNHFIWTSNVDPRLHTAGFSEHRIYTPQGDLTLLQCSTPCGKAPAAWNALNPLLGLLMQGVIDHTTHAVRSDPENTQFIPSCPNCDAPAYKHTRHNSLFTHQPYDETQRRLVDWLLQAEEVAPGSVLVLELGCGLSTPWVTRFAAEAIARQLPARLLRVNISEKDAQAPPDLVASGRALSLVATAEDALRGLARLSNHASELESCSMTAAMPVRPRPPRIPFAHEKISWTAYLDKLRDPSVKPALM